MIQARRIGHAAFDTPDLAKAIDYYTQVHGLVLASRERNKAYLATRIGQLAVELDQADTAGCKKISFEVAPSSDFSRLSRDLAQEGIQSDLRNDPLPGIPQVLTFRDPKGTAIEIFKDWNYLGAHHQVLGVGPFKLGHVAFVVQDAKLMAEFYRKILGFRVSDWVEDFFVFMRCGPDHHTVNFLTGDSVRLHHVAFEVKDFAQIQTGCELFGEKGIPIIWGPLRHGPGHNVSTYHRNCDDQVMEFYIELDQMKDEELGYFEPRPWHHDLPQRPKVWSRDKAPTIWGPPPTADYLRTRKN
jgi:catechol 2,3-dioxygenase-like lactoylglutathione lyase family enzyme